MSCMNGQVIKCVTSLKTSNSKKTQNVDMSYQTFFYSSETKQTYDRRYKK